MSITCQHHPAKNLIIFTLQGEPDMVEILEAYRYAKEQFGLTKHTIWNAREASLARLEEYDLEKLNELLALIQGADPVRVGGRSALLVGNEQDSAMIRRFASRNWRLPQKRKVVRTIEEAYAWVEKGE
ncbi:MAG: hypothetical protein KQH53_16795 [Desulfarculaceae bacterium]|nr:hypothetical protein [Desulfarculaceae bacterium]